MPYANSECMNEHLKEISLNVLEGYHAAVIIDGASWHRSHKLQIPQNITLIRKRKLSLSHIDFRSSGSIL